MSKCPRCNGCLHPIYKKNSVYWFCDFCLDYYKIFKKDVRKVWFDKDDNIIKEEQINA